MCDFLQEEMGMDRKNFLKLVLYIFTIKVNDTLAEELIPQEVFHFPTV
jgi:hypothetical protein